jgi:hypothetical protein
MEQLAEELSNEPTLEQRRDGQLWLSLRGESCVVRLARCFPWSSRNRFISLRDDERCERLLVEDPAKLDPRMRAVLEDALVEADFVLEIERVRRIDEEIEIRCWSVETSQGPRSLQTHRDEWPRPVPGGGILIRDVAGDLFYIRRPEELDEHSRQLLAVFID